MIVNQNSLGIMSGWWLVRSELRIVPSFILGSSGFPGSLFLRRQVLVHVRGVLGQLTETHSGKKNTNECRGEPSDGKEKREQMNGFNKRTLDSLS